MSDRVSLVIASHRRGAKIGPTLASVFAQTRVPDEVLVLNDGGFAETREHIAANFPTVRVVDAVGGSAGAARNLGAKHAVNPLIIFLDDDDLLHPHAVETLLQTHRTFPEAKAAYADHTFTDHNSGYHVSNHHRAEPAFQRLTWAKPVKATEDARLYDRRLYYPLLRGGLLQQPWLVDRGVFLALGGFDEAFRCHEDWELHLRIVRSHSIALSDRVISDHIHEVGRDHVSRSADLEGTSAAIIRKHLKLSAASLDIPAAVVLLRRLGMHHKSVGDHLFTTDRRAGWHAYLRSLRAWPFDSAVFVRALFLWPWKALASPSRNGEPRP